MHACFNASCARKEELLFQTTTRTWSEKLVRQPSIGKPTEEAIMQGVLRFLTVKDAVNLAAVSPEWERSVYSNLQLVIQPTEAIPNEQRLLVWQKLLNKKRPESSAAAWERLKLQAKAFVPNLSEIRKDTHRTHFRSLIRDESLIETVLLTTLFQSPRPVAYCQGMNYIAALFLVVSNSDERSAAEMLYEWLFSRDNIRRFEDNFHQVSVEAKILSRFALDKCPQLMNLLRRYNLDLSLFTFTWLLLHFVYDLQEQLKLLLAIWDQILVQHDTPFLLQVCAFLLTAMENAVVVDHWAHRPEEDFIKFFKDFPRVYLRRFESTSEFLEKIATAAHTKNVEEPSPPLPPPPPPPGSDVYREESPTTRLKFVIRNSPPRYNEAFLRHALQLDL